MSLEKLREELSVETETQVKAILAEAKATAKTILKEAEANAAKSIAGSQEAAEQEAQALELEVSAARLAARKLFAEARNELVANVFAELREQLIDFTKKREYPALFKKLAAQASKELSKDGGECVLYASKRDYALLLKDYKNLSREPIECIGGVVASARDGRLKINNTLDALLEEKSEEIRQKVLQQLGEYSGAQKPRKKK